ncbi:hypothetical protein JTL72_07765 [Pseudomonas aeruginosa]|nr:hypothetical protein [Pseudomonas aeruginosa]MBN0068162.1 hypothetical protein [Pseudomonas aeruginosa]MBN0274883.1 hypothetical protein [Pseudomonas aeruginosa]MBN0289082.1 hypothetical protein [Pseudomonas aeruginosa]MBN0337158.1 hypothetical protein [Pseudomonas aeruginosa]
MNKANECTCPSGDGSLVHPCPAHPAVDQADVAAKLTFINGRPAMCGCQVEYSDGGGEYSDVIYVTLCAKHSGSAILDLVATNRIALTPEYEGQWHADLYLDREIPLAKVEGATPAEAVLALMSAERIDPEQESVEQAGGERWDALQSIMEWTAAENIPDDRKLCLIRNAARAALAQPSPAHAEQAEAERPEVVAYFDRNYPSTGDAFIWSNYEGSPYEPVMTVSQHERIVEARWNRAMDLMGEHVARISEKFKAERDAALARVEQQERTIAGMNEAHAKLAGLYEAAQAQHSVPEGWMLVECGIWTQEQVDEMQKTVARFRNSEFVDNRALAMAVADAGQCKAPEISLAELLAAAPGNSAQHSVPEGWKLVPIEPLLNMMSDKDHDTRIMAERQLLAVLAAAPGKEGV